MVQIYRYFIIVATLLLNLEFSWAQLVSSPFGQNRLQYEKYKWQRYESPSFAFSFTEENKSLLEFIVPVAEKSYIELKSILEYQVRQRVEIIIYSDFSDYLQSNIGLVSPTINTGGKTKLLDNKILIYFDGNHKNLELLIRESIARTIMNRMLFGSNLQEIVQNSVLLNLPEWFTEGLIAHATEEWNDTYDNELRDDLVSKRFSNFLELAQQKPILAGRSLFHYISKTHGQAAVSNLLYLSRINRSVESGFLYVFGNSFYSIAGTNWYNYYSNRYNEDNQNRLFPNAGSIDLKHKRNSLIRQVRLSPDSKYLCYSEHEQGEFYVYVITLETKERKLVFKGGNRDLTEDVDNNYPFLLWKNKGSELVLFTENKDKVFHQSLVIGQQKKFNAPKKINGIERLTSVQTYGDDAFVMTAIQNNQSDIYLFDQKDLTQITKDLWDETDACAYDWNGKRGILFISNRDTQSYQSKPQISQTGFTDLYFYQKGLPSYIRLTKTPNADESMPQVLPDKRFAFLSLANGIKNRFVGQIDSIIRDSLLIGYKDAKIDTLKDNRTENSYDSLQSVYFFEKTGNNYPVTNYSRSIQAHDIRNKVADLIFREGKYQIFVRDIKTEESTDFEPTQYRNLRDLTKLTKDKMKTDSKKQKENKTEQEISEELQRVQKEIEQDKKDSIKPKVNTDTSKVDIDNYSFQTEFEIIKQPGIQEPIKGNKDSIVNPTVLVEDENGNLKPVAQNNEPSVSKNINKAVLFDPAKIIKYKNLFKVDELTFQVDNTPLFWGMDLYLQGYYRFPTVGLMLKTAFTDLLEDYRLEVGIRLPVNFNGLEYFLSFEDRKSRLDKKFSIYRRSRTDNYTITDTLTNDVWAAKGNNVKHIAMAELSYPISKFSRFQATLMYQNDAVNIIAENRNSLASPEYNFSQIALRAEYVFDNTIGIRINGRKGFRCRAYADYYQNFNTNYENDKLKINLLNPTLVAGFDARYYLSFDNKTIFAFRASAAASFGKEKMLYALGGMENWIFPTYNENIPMPDASQFSYQLLAAPLRGFQSNIRNGSNYALINAEIRIPIIEYFSITPPKNAILRNLQLIGFYDIGTAWQGLSPFSKDNPLNTTLIDPGSGSSIVSPVRVRVNYFRRPIVHGAGFGIRTVVLGYFLRLDYAWGIETGQVLTPRVYLSLGMDF